MKALLEPSPASLSAFGVGPISGSTNIPPFTLAIGSASNHNAMTNPGPVVQSVPGIDVPAVTTLVESDPTIKDCLRPDADVLKLV